MMMETVDLVARNALRYAAGFEFRDTCITCISQTIEQRLWFRDQR